MNLHDACDYIILKCTEAGVPLNALKLQKLIYYAQAWHLAFFHKPLFAGRFQAWIHGPVSRELYDRFAGTKSLYSEVTDKDVRAGFDLAAIPQPEAAHLDAVLEAYAKFSGAQLEEMSHREDPWIAARQGCRPSERCEREVDEQLMGQYYRARIKTG